MPFDDRYGNTLSTSSDAARDRYVEGVDHVLAATYGGVQSFEATVAADPGFALGHAGLARARMYEGDMAGAKSAIARASELSADTTSRERQHVETLSLLLSGQAGAARDLVLSHVQDFPRDAFCAQICTNVFGLIGFSGHVAREAELLAYTTRLLPHYGEDWWMLSMHALSLCEVGEVAASLELMDRALALNPENANGSHFKAHAQYEAGETDAGLGFLETWMEGYDSRGVLHGHLSWHMALWALELGQIDRMWALIDAGIAPGGSQGLPINIVTDTAAIYHRAELAGVSVSSERWQAISDFAAKFFPASGQSFADMHSALCHAMAGESERLEKLMEGTKGYAADLVGPVAHAWKAIAAQQWAEALRRLTPVMADHVRFGGSRAQRDLLELTYVNLLLRLGLRDEARRAMQGRRPIFADHAPVVGYD
ncbi:tetratricopeptide repeat protein [Falsiphaeobacter marinintestinus]|uniref:tetratricopeptide repeat protein n=1 Tax=Falsiphaeobacter marinintestinus TaxID=1492905 RepID=UPI0011B68002|nr:tetratricopeptide repeat protein [Phaeobacter marinintestinus]